MNKSQKKKLKKLTKKEKRWKFESPRKKENAVVKKTIGKMCMRKCVLIGGKTY